MLFEPILDCYTVRYTIDGILRRVLDLPQKVESSLIARFKVLSRMNIAEHRRTQDGTFTVKYNGISFSTIKDLINQYIPTISSSLNIYMNDNKQKTILIKEFRKSLQYLSNIIAGKEKKDNSNIAFNLIS